MKLTIIGICGLVLTPFISHGAHFTLTNEADSEELGGQATQINDNTVLFTIDFEFSDNIFDISVPIMAEDGITYADRVDVVGYALNSENDRDLELENVSGIVLSRSEIVDGKYFVPKGETATFTLAIFATYTEKVSDPVYANVTKLPYWLDERRTTVHQNQLDDLARPTLRTE